MSLATPVPPRPRGSVTEEKSECRGLIKAYGLGRHGRPSPGGFVNQASHRSQEIHLNSYHDCSLLQRGATTTLNDCPCLRAWSKWAEVPGVELRFLCFQNMCSLCCSSVFTLTLWPLHQVAYQLKTLLLQYPQTCPSHGSGSSGKEPI